MINEKQIYADGDGGSDGGSSDPGNSTYSPAPDPTPAPAPDPPPPPDPAPDPNNSIFPGGNNINQDFSDQSLTTPGFDSHVIEGTPIDTPVEITTATSLPDADF